ncbi:anaphase-promoting complex subunit 1 [Episyrphus balteatus]|uniref:anaphase-promoting complex subunit 1 n=1 Tax=Episyrphus balteatus TaxID=286459 RepID=UPI0024854275|nr:anaphase-promoting complex subunit 1 [Episyrphus balteatus]
MIAASEPLEFIPRGRQAVEEHPGPVVPIPNSCIPTENVLLYRMQNVNISSNDEPNEFWYIREIYTECRRDSPQTQQYKTKNSPDYMTDFYVNSEEELYVKKNTAVWNRGLHTERGVLPRMCFTCETPIKFAFFCNQSFLHGTMKKECDKTKLTSICLIDASCLRVYCSNGEDFTSNLEFPVSNVWVTKYGILLEKEAINTIVQNLAISMPRIFSLSHPLDEICPVLIKLSNGVVSYLTEADYSVIFTTESSDLVLLYDNKMGKHFVSKLRKATEDEISYVGCNNDTAFCSASVNQTQRPGMSSFSQNSMKFSAGAKNSTAYMPRSSLGTTGCNPHISKFLSSQSINSGGPNFNRTNSQSPLTRLQSSMGPHSLSMQDIRKPGQAQPSKAIVPDYCLEHIWTEQILSKEFCEIATKAFVHVDLIGQTYLCFLLPRSAKLQLVRIVNFDEENTQIEGEIFSIAARDAVVLERMKMIAILDPSGTLTLYTGTVFVSKVHVVAVIPSSLPQSKPSCSPFPRRSSLLPTASQKSDSNFEEELHMLSPVHPLQPLFTARSSSGVCLNLRDPAGNRLTLVYPTGKMYRLSLPLINETYFVTRCIEALRQILKRETFIQLITHWYGARNPPGSKDFSGEKEWQTFKTVLSELMGRVASSDDSSINIPCQPEEPKKRRKNDEVLDGTDDDWDYLESILNRRNKEGPFKANSIKFIDCSALLFKEIPKIFFAFHLLYEDLKLDNTMHDSLCSLGEFLYQLATDMQLTAHCLHYFLDFPHLASIKSQNIFTEDHAKQMYHKNLLSEPVPNIFQQVENILKNREIYQYSFIEGINTMSRNALQLISLIIHGCMKIKNWIKLLEFPETMYPDIPIKKKRLISTNVPLCEQLIQMLINMDMTRTDVERLPVSLHLIIAECLEHGRLSPPMGCAPPTYELILRSELLEHTRYQYSTELYSVKFSKANIDAEDSLSPRCPPNPNGFSRAESADDDGMENIDTKLLSLRFPDDLRIAEVRRLLISSEPVLIDIVQSPGISDHEFIEEQEKQLYALCTRTMTLPMGRGMFTLRTSIPTPTESMPIPKLCLTGKEPVKGATIEMQQIEFPANMNLWPSFHNGVAAGLRISPNAKDVDSTWIVYNKPKGPTEVTTEHAGFLMALGLNGHLKTLSFMSIYDYLVKCDEMTSVGLLLGISATHRGTMDTTTTKLLSVHIEALLPATALELDIPQNIQVASLMGIGLIYQGTAKRHIAEVLLQEIGRPPGPEMENSVERESYALTAGLALGLVTLGHGEAPAGLRDLQLPDTLHYYMVGGNKRPLLGSQKEKYKLPSFQVREGDTVNIDVTAPGATLALGLMFFNTDNKAVAQWMDPPDTSYLLDLVRPDLLLLRTIARGLILWKDVQPSSEWLFDQFPANLRFDINRGPVPKKDLTDHEAITQAYCNIISGAAVCIGLKYAGTENKDAFKALKKTIKLFLGFSGKYVGEYAGRATVESSLMLILISISLVYAGTGDLEIMRMIRYLRSRIGTAHSQVTYGSQMAIHMSLGFLFLGAGRYTLSKRPEAVAALVCALFPKFPCHSNDNRYHLQAFRHLYVLAVEPRLFLPRDLDTKKLCLCQISYIEVGKTELKKLPMAPCMLPDLSTLKSVIVDDQNYWPVCFEKGRNWDQLVKALEVSGCIDIKKRSGCHSHLDDPDRLKSLLAQTLTTEQYTCWKIDTKSLETFSSDPIVIGFTDRFLSVDARENKLTKVELERYQQLIVIFYNSVIKDKMHGLPIYLSIVNTMQAIKSNSKTYDVWQLKLIEIYTRMQTENILISKEIVNSVLENLKSYIESCQVSCRNHLKKFITSHCFDSLCELSSTEISKVLAVVVFYGILPNVLSLVDLTGKVNYMRLLYELNKINMETSTINCIIKVLDIS